MRQGTGDRGQGTVGGERSRAGLTVRCVRDAVGRGLAALVATCMLAVGARAAGAATRYLAVFADGRTLEVVGARLVDEEHLALDLGDGAALTVPIVRVERVIEAETVDDPAPITPPPCPTSFAREPLPAGVPFRSEIVRASEEAGLHPWLVASVVEAESAFDPWAVSRVGARGLMQLMPAVWLENGVLNPHDVEANLRAGCAHLKALLRRFPDVTLALAAYNAGAATVERAAGVPAYRETREFVRRVLGKFCPPVDGAAEPPVGAGTAGSEEPGSS